MPLQHLRSSTANKRPVPGSMSDGQIALNTASTSPGVFFKDSTGALVKTGPVHIGTTAPNVSPASGGTSGNSVGEQWLDTTGGTYILKTWDGTAWRATNITSAEIVDGTIVNGDINTTAGILVSKLGNGTARQLVQTNAAGNGVEWTSNVSVPGTLGVSGITTLSDNVVCTGSGALTVPLGATAGRPGVPASGMIRYNTTTSGFEGYGATGWSTLGAGSSANANIQEFATTGTWTKPAGATTVLVELWGGGGGGGSGRRAPAASGRAGGGGGGGGAYVYEILQASGLTSTVSVTIGAGGAGAAAPAGDNTYGNAGSAGGNTSFGSYVISYGGGAGDGGTVTGYGGGGGGMFSAGVTSQASVLGGGLPSGGTGFGGGFVGGGDSGFGGALGGKASASSNLAGIDGSISVYGGAGGGAGAGIAISSASFASGLPGQSFIGKAGTGGGATHITNHTGTSGLHYANGFLLSGTGNAGGLLISSGTTPGTSWIYRKQYGDGARCSFNGFLWDGSQYVAWGLASNLNGYAFYTSTDLFNWTFKSLTPCSLVSSLYPVAFGNGVYVAVDTATSSTGAFSIYSSTDLINWTGRVSQLSSKMGNMIFDGTRFLVGLESNAGLVYYSTNGTSWSTFNTSLTQGVAHLTSNGAGIYVAVAPGGATSKVSTNSGSTWSNLSGQPTGFAATVGGAYYGGGYFLIANASSIYYSTDGTTYTQASGTGSTFTSAKGVYASASNFVVGAAGSTFVTYTATTITGAWTQQTPTSIIANGENGQSSPSIAGGGGGGGAALNGYAAGAGGAGGNGYARITSW